MSKETKITVKELPIDVKDDAIYVINQPNPNSYTHNFFKYPCKFIPEIPRWAIKSFIGDDKADKKILDPFAGSGTTMLESALAGIPAFGTELDDIAKLIIKVKTTALTGEEVGLTRSICFSIIDRLERHDYTENEVIKPMINNLEHWFREDILNDLAITSPPYINAFDYVRIMRLENLWLNMATEDELRNKKKYYVGTESIRVKNERENLDILNDSELLRIYFNQIHDVDERRALIVKKFFEDMKKNLQEVHRTLKPGAKYVIVIGNSNIRKINVESWKVLKDIALTIGYNYITHVGYEIQNPYIRIPRGNQGGKIAIDHILVIAK